MCVCVCVCVCVCEGTFSQLVKIIIAKYEIYLTMYKSVLHIVQCTV